MYSNEVISGSVFWFENGFSKTIYEELVPYPTAPPPFLLHPPPPSTDCLFHSVIAYNQITGSGWLIFHRVIQGYPPSYTLYSFQIVE